MLSKSVLRYGLVLAGTMLLAGCGMSSSNHLLGKKWKVESVSCGAKSGSEACMVVGLVSHSLYGAIYKFYPGHLTALNKTTGEMQRMKVLSYKIKDGGKEVVLYQRGKNGKNSKDIEPAYFSDGYRHVALHSGAAVLHMVVVH